ncbi:MAG: glycosyltransferase family 1 protein [Gammaproteobacteria bacterium]|nr:glycosyltransferase family 1 protein [Gammaproteobacteria bacterium]
MLTVLFDLTILETDTRIRGVGRHIIELARQLAECKKVRVIFLEEISWLGRSRFTEDAPSAIARLTAPDKHFTNHKLWAYRLRLGLSRAFRESGADLLHLPHSSATPLFATGIKRVVTCHDLIPLRYPQHYVNWKSGFRRGRRRLDLRRFNGADRIIAISQATAKDLQTILNISPMKISVVYNGVELERWRSELVASDCYELAALGFRAKGYLLCVGDADWRKNHRGMIGALAIVRRHLPDLKLVCAGKLTDARRRMVLNEAMRHGVGDAVALTGHVEDATLKALYRHALATLFVSYAEGFGLPVVEAMACGSPVITSDRSSMVEVSQDAALLVDPSRNDAIAAAILAFARDDGLRRNHIALGLKRAKRFSLGRQARDTEAVYLSI